jgi:hypothetical protein
MTRTCSGIGPPDKLPPSRVEGRTAPVGRGVVNDVMAVYFRDPALASAFAALVRSGGLGDM